MLHHRLIIPISPLGFKEKMGRRRCVRIDSIKGGAGSSNLAPPFYVSGRGPGAVLFRPGGRLSEEMRLQILMPPSHSRHSTGLRPEGTFREAGPPGTHRRSGLFPFLGKRRTSFPNHKTCSPFFVSDKQRRERGRSMTVYQWLRECLQWEAEETEPDPRRALQRLLGRLAGTEKKKAPAPKTEEEPK